MSNYISKANLQIADCLFNFIEQQALPGTGLDNEKFWQSFSDIVTTLMPENKALLEKRDTLQAQIDDWHKTNEYQPDNLTPYKTFLQDIGYLVPDVPDFEIGTMNVDSELATLAGPQLVVPIMNARFALNAVNARWGSLYDALYGSNIISDEGGAEAGKGYNPARGRKVIAYGRDFLDNTLPLTDGSHTDVTEYRLSTSGLICVLSNGTETTLKESSALAGFTGELASPTSILFKHNGLHIELLINRDTNIGSSDKAGISDILIESALTTIMDCEDSVAAVDAEDKVLAYQNWLGLNKGTLTESVDKNGKTFTRSMNPDRLYKTIAGEALTLKGRSLMFVRNVGHLMTNNAILTADGNEVPEGIMDAVVTSLIAMHDLQGNNTQSNANEQSVYIVKPKMHGPEEVAFADKLFASVEDALGLARNTIKMGIMDEERRTSVNLKACIYRAKDRVVFINTGFLDRTGDEIHTSMLAGPMTRKNDIKATKWIGAYENNNVDVGLNAGFSGKAQIGKGMWPVPDDMASMMTAKVGHVQSGANTAWVPSPTAATLHALHYHQENVASLQQTLTSRTAANIDDILTIPLAENTDWSQEDIEQELDNNSQGILGYVVRWIDQGVGCSKVPDINNVGLMEDRATLRISSQHMANWLHHGICSQEQAMNSMKKMARVVDGQNANDPLYQNMADNFDQSIAFQAACALVFKGKQQPSGYTEPLLHAFRLKKKQQA